jgi:hypothetical protein
VRWGWERELLSIEWRLIASTVHLVGRCFRGSSGAARSSRLILALDNSIPPSVLLSQEISYSIGLRLEKRDVAL